MELPELGGISESSCIASTGKPNSRWGWWAGGQLPSEKLRWCLVWVGSAAVLTCASLCKVFPAEQQSGKTLQRAEGGAGAEQVLESKPGLAAEQTEGGGESVKGNL